MKMNSHATRTIARQIEEMRCRLLDLSRRNPLLSTRFAANSASVLRVVDELPEVIIQKLGAGEKLTFAPLPPLGDAIPDEETPGFKDALSRARLEDPEYLAAMAALDQTTEENLDKTQSSERSLKDRVRKTLGMPPRKEKPDHDSLRQHAINAGISPNYELPLPDEMHEDGRHGDNLIQTLLLPEQLERRLNALLLRCRTLEQDTGINSLKIAFGFLEWRDQSGADGSMAPLVLLPVRLKKIMTPKGGEFRLAAAENEAEGNMVLDMKFRQSFATALPKYETFRRESALSENAVEKEALENYFREIGAIKHESLKTCRVHRQVAIGLFPSSQMIMFEDLDPAALDIQGKAAESLLIGASTEETPAFSPDYDVDSPGIESRITGLVLEADSSQFSVMVDAMDGKNLAVEGPPGTGKSQTITNVIANAIAAGKKVLFVAEKLAALEVVHSKLKRLKLNVHALSLHSSGATREQVMASIRERLRHAGYSSGAAGEIDMKRRAFGAVRAKLAEYVGKLRLRFGATEDTVSTVIGKGIAEAEVLHDLPFSLRQQTVMDPAAVEACYAGLDAIIEHANEFESVWRTALATESFWRGVRDAGAGIAARDVMRHRLGETAGALRREEAKQAHVESLALPVESEQLEEIDALAAGFLALKTVPDRNMLSRAINNDAVDATLFFLTECLRFQRERTELLRIVADTESAAAPAHLREIRDLCATRNHLFIRPGEWRDTLRALEDEHDKSEKACEAIGEFIRRYPELVHIRASLFSEAAELLHDITPEAFSACTRALGQLPAVEKAKAICETGRRLLAEKEKLGNAFVSLNIPYEAGQVDACADILEKTGFLGSFFPRFKAAKKTYSEISIGNGFNQSRAAADMRSLAGWMRAAEEYARDHSARELFGTRFAGLESDFGLLEKITNYSGGIVSVLGDGRAPELLREMLSGRRQFSLALAALPDAMPGLTLAEFREKAGRDAAKHAEFAEFVAKISPLLSTLADSTDTAVSLLAPTADRLERHRARAARLNDDQGAAGVLQAAYKGSATGAGDLRAEMEALDLLRRYRGGFDRILPIMETNGWRNTAAAIDELRRARKETAGHLRDLEAEYGIPFRERIAGLTPADAAARLEEAAGDEDGFRIHVDCAHKRSVIAEAGFEWVVKVFERDGIPPGGFSTVLHAVIVRAAVNAIDQKYGPIVGEGGSSGESMDKLRAELASLDREITKLNQIAVDRRVCAAYVHIPGNSGRPVSNLTEKSLIDHEAAKKKMYIPIRELTRRAGRALRELKPCWMMSPLAVAQYLPKGQEPLFDLCIIDEASQMPFENALGALLRSKRVMVVGDTNQLPPTNFFRANFVDDESGDSSEPAESILQIANGVFRPARRLRWHYRSRHSGLIQFSNRRIYNNDLVIFPSPSEARPGRGVSLVKVGGDYHAGLNGNEASRMIEEAANFMRGHPKRSLGIVTLNKKQCSLINEEMERLRGSDPAVAGYIDGWSENLESFFIKNLENVQGDERDVIFIGTVYGPDKLTGKLSLNFGPITGKDAGPRRLNVLFTRARERIVTFTSMASSDIKTDAFGSRGVQMLKDWLEYCESGGRMPPTGRSGGTAESTFATYVAKRIEAMGCEIQRDVGVSGCGIDIGVSHRKWPHGFILGVEGDGDSYCSHRSARDRDRLRDEVLRGLGWKLHRIWSYDWFNHPGKEIARLRAAIEARLEELGISNGMDEP
ncbi:MAG: DUF4011 domain-containing protein [Planctomycetota bacterium]|jgi:hypothetical protein|nr:DUF4011 domain-containing protein [Planctomycetota bacterium]